MSRRKRPALVVCSLATTPLLRKDNQTGPCHDCFDLLQWAPDTPDLNKVCTDCAHIRTTRAEMDAAMRC